VYLAGVTSDFLRTATCIEENDIDKSNPLMNKKSYYPMKKHKRHTTINIYLLLTGDGFGNSYQARNRWKRDFSYALEPEKVFS